MIFCGTDNHAVYRAVYFSVRGEGAGEKVAMLGLWNYEVLL